MSSAPVTPASETVEQRVERLLCRWRAETAALSSSTKITAHPAYQEIISLGVAALPFLFKGLRQNSWVKIRVPLLCSAVFPGFVAVPGAVQCGAHKASACLYR